jgi:hypothetical protein
MFILKGHDHEEVDFVTWTDWLGANPNTTVAATEISGFAVTTVFIGFDVSRSTPTLFETRVVRDGVGGEMRKYTCWAEAELGHMEVVEALER